MKRSDMVVRVVGVMGGVGFLKVIIYNSLRPGILEQDVHGVGFSVEVLGGLFSIVLAFVIFVVWEQFNRVQAGIAAEASALEDVCRIAGGLMDRTKFGRVRIVVADYLRATIAEEPQKLANGEGSIRAEKRFDELCDMVRLADVNNPREAVVYGELLRAITRASDARDDRLSVSVTRIPDTLWGLLVFAAFALIIAFFMLGIHSLMLSCLLVATISGVVCLLLMVVHDMDNPFAGAWNVSYAAFKAMQIRIDQL